MLRASMLSLLALGLSAQQPAAQAPKPAKTTGAKKAGKANAKVASKDPKDAVLARVGDETVTQSDLEAVIAQLPQQQQMQILMVQGGKEEMIRRLAEKKLLSVKAKRLGLDKSKEFQLALVNTEEELLAREFLRIKGPELQKKVAVTDEDVKAYYEGHLKDFSKPATASARHILVLVKGGRNGEKGLSDDEAKARIATIQGKLKAGEKFDDLAKEYSDDPGSKEKGGLIEDFDPKFMVPEFAKAVETQPLSQVGEPVKTEYGYHLVEVEKRVDAHQQTFDEVKEQARQAAQKARQEQVWDGLMTELKKEIPVEILAPKPPTPVAAPATTPAPAATSAPASTPKPDDAGAQK